MTLYERAEAMEAEGAESEAIRKETGWFKSFDGEWRYEIDDSKMRYLNPTLDAEGFTTLGELIEHDALFKAYPQLRDLKVEIKADTKYNYYSPGRKKIVLMETVFEDGDFKKSQDKKLSGKTILIHEIQHAIQHIEGFARGTSPSEWRQVLRERRKKVGVIVKGKTQKAVQRITEKYGDEVGQDARRYIDLAILEGRDKITKAELEELDVVEFDLEMILVEDFDIIDKALMEEAEYINSLRSIKGDAELNYYNTAGEIEAYDVGERVDLDAESRRAVRPDIDRNPDEVKFADPTKWRKMHSEERSEAEDYSEYDKPITINDVHVLRSIGRKSINQFTSEDIKKARKWAYKFYKELGVKSPFFRAWFGDWRAYQNTDKDRVTVTDIPQYIDSNEARKKNRGSVLNNDTGWDIRISREGETNTISHSGTDRLSEFGLAGIRGLIENAILLDSEIHEHHSNNAKDDRIAFDHRLYSLGKDKTGNVALYRITVEETYQDYKHPNDMRFHNLKYIEKVADTIGSLTHAQWHGAESTNDGSTTTYSISDLFEFVNSFDKDFNKGKKCSEELLDKETGLPRVFDHTTEDGSSIKVFKNGAGQIKSAETGIDANIGTFDRGTKKIQYSRKAGPKRTEAEEKELYYASLLRSADEFNNLEKGRFFSASIYKGETLKKIPGVFRTGLARNKKDAELISASMTRKYSSEDSHQFCV